MVMSSPSKFIVPCNIAFYSCLNKKVLSLEAVRRKRSNALGHRKQPLGQKGRTQTSLVPPREIRNTLKFCVPHLWHLLWANSVSNTRFRHFLTELAHREDHRCGKQNFKVFINSQHSIKEVCLLPFCPGACFQSSRGSLLSLRTASSDNTAFTQIWIKYIYTLPKVSEVWEMVTT